MKLSMHSMLLLGLVLLLAACSHPDEYGQPFPSSATPAPQPSATMYHPTQPTPSPTPLPTPKPYVTPTNRRVNLDGKNPATLCERGMQLAKIGQGPLDIQVTTMGWVCSPLQMNSAGVERFQSVWLVGAGLPCEAGNFVTVDIRVGDTRNTMKAVPFGYRDEDIVIYSATGEHIHVMDGMRVMGHLAISLNPASCSLVAEEISLVK